MTISQADWNLLMEVANRIDRSRLRELWWGVR
jgi:hypothetical protein